MTVAHLCDGPGCGGRIDVKGYGWFGLDEAVKPALPRGLPDE